jgi:hypothetical protein
LLWRARQDSNLRPSAPEADALSTELQAPDWYAQIERKPLGSTRFPNEKTPVRLLRGRAEMIAAFR